MLKKITSGIVSAVLLGASVMSSAPYAVMNTATAADGKFNYVDALDGGATRYISIIPLYALSRF